MTNTLALWFAGILIAVLAADFLLFDWAIVVAFMRMFIEFIDFVAFWR